MSSPGLAAGNLRAPEPEVCVAYTIASHGRPIGETELEFVRMGGPGRSGWFHPNEWGESLMPLITAVLPDGRSAGRRSVARDTDAAAGGAPPRHSNQAADALEALRSSPPLDLTLHDASGALIPTEFIGIQDVHLLLPLWDEADDEAEAETRARESAGEEAGHELDDGADELELTDFPSHSADDDPGDWLGEIESYDDVEDFSGEWEPDDPSTFPRYHIHLVLADEAAIP